jgi:hypothetical protein
MDTMDFHKFFQTLLPIAIFVAWALISRPAKKRKKEQAALERKRRMEQAEEASGDLASSHPEHPASHPSGGAERWKQTLEDIFGEMGVPVEREPAPPPAQAPRREHAEISQESQSLEDLEPEVPPAGSKVAAQKTATPLSEGAYALHDSPITSKAVYAIGPDQAEVEGRRLNALGVYSAAELQRLIVWSEVIGKPLAFRESEIL